MRFVGDLQGHLAFGGQRGLGDQQRRHRRIGDTLRHSITDLGTASGQGADQIANRVVLAELHQPGDGVQLVGELVGLGAQRVGHALVGRQLGLHGRQFGAVAHRGDRADALTAAARGAPVERQNPGPRGDHDVLASASPSLVFAGEQEVGDRRVEPDAASTRLTDRVVGEVEQFFGAVVEHGDLAVVAHADHPFPDAVQQRFPVVGQAGDLGDLQPAGVPLDAPRQQPRGEQAERGAEPEVDQQPFTGTGEQLPDRRIRAR